MHAAARARTIRAPPFIDPHGYARHRPETTLVLSLPFALRFLLATDPDALTLVLGVVYHTISRHLIGRADLTRVNGEAGAVTLVQRFGSSLNLNIHFHMIVPDGVYLPVDGVAPVFRHVSGPTERDIESAWLAGDGEPGLLDDLIGHSITYRIAVGPRAGQKLFTLQTLPAREEVDDQQGDHRGAARAGG